MRGSNKRTNVLTTPKVVAMNAQVAYAQFERGKDKEDWHLNYFKFHKPYACDGVMGRGKRVIFVGG